MSPHFNNGNLSRPCIIVRLVLKKIYCETYRRKTEYIFTSVFLVDSDYAISISHGCSSE